MTIDDLGNLASFVHGKRMENECNKPGENFIGTRVCRAPAARKKAHFSKSSAGSVFRGTDVLTKMPRRSLRGDAGA